MLSYDRSRFLCRQGVAASCLIGLLGLMALLLGCNSGGSSGSISPQSSTNPQLEQEAAQGLLNAYQTALLQEDIDRLQTLLHEDGGRAEGQSFRETMTETFRRFNITGIEISEVSPQSIATPLTISFRETLSMEDPIARSRQTRSVRTTWRLVKQSGPNGTVTILIAEVTRTAPYVEVITRGLAQAGVPARVEVTETTESFAAAGVEVEVPETGDRTLLVASGARFLGSFTPPGLAHPQALRVRLRSHTGAQMQVSHRYSVRRPGDGAVERIAEPVPGRFFAVAAGRDGTAWFGGEGDRSRVAGTLVQVSADGQSVLRREHPFLSQMPAEAVSRIEDLAIDEVDRVHALFLARVSAGGTVLDTRVVANGVLVQDLQHPDQLCQTVNVIARDPQTGEIRVDPAYPFLVNGEPSPSTRVLAAGGRDIWLYGSDGGVARVADGFRNGECPQDRVEVRYDPIFRRGDSGLLSNTVPALAPGPEGALWFGTAFGLTRLQNGQFTPMPFDSNLSLRGDVATLEAFFQEVARAIFEARPVSAVQLGGVSFLDAFGAPLLKEDLIFSLAQNAQGRLWAGTFGGGIRRLEARAGGPQETPPLTRQQGLVSNIIFALAVGPDGAIWAATEEGVSRIQEMGGEPVITNYTTLDGLAVPVRDVAVGGNGAVWFATDGGMFQMRTATGVLRGVVRDTTGRPVAGADVRLPGTGFWTVTDAEGRFVLVNLPPGATQLLVDGSAAIGGPLTAEVVKVTIAADEQALEEPVRIAPRPSVAHLEAVSGDGQMGAVGTPLSDPLAVAAKDGTGRGIAGVPVTFMVTAGSGFLASEVVITDSLGVSANTLTPTAAAMADDPIQVTASADGQERVFTATAVVEPRPGDDGAARLLVVSGNNQSAQPGQELPEPLVVQLEDQFGTPLAGVEVTATIDQGEGVLIPSSSPDGRTAVVRTDPQGKASFRLQVGASDVDIKVRISALNQAVQFFAIVGAVDTPDIPRSLAVSRNIVYVADRLSGLVIVDANDPTKPTRLDPVQLEGTEDRLAAAGAQLYVATDLPARLYTLDITNPLQPKEIGSADLPAEVQNHGMAGVAVQGNFVYVVTDARTSNEGTLQVVDVSNPAEARVVGNVSLGGRPAALAVSAGFAYVPTASPGLLIFNIGNPVRPRLQNRLDGNFPSSIAVAGSLGYIVESLEKENRFTVLDLSNPARPRRRGVVPVADVFQLDTRFPIAVAGRIVYLVQFSLGLQAIDVNIPDAPRLVGRVNTPSMALNAAATEQFIYVSDLVFGVQVVQGPGSLVNGTEDADHDGVINFFDALPDDPREWQDTDHDGIGDNAEADDDNDGFSDVEELQAIPPTDSRDPHSFPVSLPPLNTRTLVVDASSPFGPRERRGTSEAPYRSITEAMWATRALQARRGNVQSLVVRPSKYSQQTTQEIFPLNFFGLPSLTMQGAGAENTVIDAGFNSMVIVLPFQAGIVIEGFTLTHGAFGLLINGATELTLRGNRIIENALSGIEMGINSNVGNVITENLIEQNGLFGMNLFDNSAAVIVKNIFRHNVSNGIFVDVNSTAEICLNTIIGNGAHGANIFISSRAIIDENVILDNSINGIQVEDRSKATITNNVIRNNINDGIFIVTESLAEMNVNEISDNGGDGIQVQDASNLTVTSNLIRGNNGAGIFVVTESLAEITSNDITGNAFGGIWIQDNSSALMRSNTIRSNDESGVVFVAESSGTLIDNTVSSNARHGIHIGGGSLAAISGGTIGQNGGHGVFVVGASMAEIGLQGEVLTVAQNGGAGIFITNDGSSAQINSSRIVFVNNAGGDIVGPVVDLPDGDLDGLSDDEEVELDTDPNNPDTDGDSFSDGVEVVSNSDPLVGGSVPTMILYGAAHHGPGGASSLYAIDPMTGRAVWVGTIGFQRVSGMDADVGRTLYATGVNPTSGKQVLLTINPTTGAGTEVGPVGVQGSVTDLSFRNVDGKLFTYEALPTNHRLLTIDKRTGTATLVGSTGLSLSGGNGMAFDRSDALFHSTQVSEFNILDQNTGAATFLLDLSFPPPANGNPRINAMDFQPQTGILFASVNDGSDDAPENYLATINTISGQVNIIGRTVDGLDALVWVPVQ